MLLPTLGLLLSTTLCALSVTPPVSAEPLPPGGGADRFTVAQDFSLVMTIRDIKKNGKVHEAVIRMGALDDRFALISTDDGEGVVSQMIYNTEDRKTTMVTTDKKGRKQGFRMRMPKLGNVIAATTDEMAEYITISRTGERKTIDGYDCEKIIVTDNKHNTTTESWVTQDVDLTYADVFGGLSNLSGVGKQQFKTPGGAPAVLEGMPIRSTTTDGKTTTEMYITDIRLGDDLDRSLFDTGGVEIQEMRF
ncbi:DUF4412 domain-containing protein [Lewinella sp. JB7]|uniref:DUF4412 domain-containing protein n=1 Tax=Lewinella sp. JB7 TaxID=2962887 RepID=UPI0020CA23B4|nr:DUF4412 domain-containing protein [Lewinella sp. JB7]MCP9234777.1 DUF4412 domain-containing protein [Lewinella sp. JB7]